MALSTRLLAVLSAVTLSVSGAAVPAAQASLTQDHPIISQGDAIATMSGHGCTIGYNDIKNNRSYIAAHCADEGETFSVIAKDFSDLWESVGEFHINPYYNAEASAQDWGYIQWKPGEVELEPNGFSDDTIVPLTSLEMGEPICFHGKGTHFNDSTGVTCGKYMGAFGGTFFADFGTAGEQGDSGAPMWAPGKGFVGVLSGDQYSILNGVQYKTRAIRGAVINDTREKSYSSYDLSDLFAAYEDYLNPKPTTASRPAPAPTTTTPKQSEPTANPVPKPAEPSNGGSSTGGIIGIVVGLLALLGIGSAAAYFFR